MFSPLTEQKRKQPIYGYLKAVLTLGDFFHSTHWAEWRKYQKIPLNTALMREEKSIIFWPGLFHFPEQTG